MTIDTGVPPILDAADAAAAPVALPQPRLLWPSLRRGGKQNPKDWTPDDLDYFPDQMLINERYSREGGSCHSPLFRDSVRRAFRQVLIVDSYLLTAGARAFEEVLSWFPNEFEAPIVKIACEGVGEKLNEAQVKAKFTDREREINTRRESTDMPKLSLQVKLDFKSKSTPYVHDRFAIVDEELWHFGSTVGGMHPGVNAVSRGWSTTASKATAFFQLVWQQRGGRAFPGRHR